MADVWAPLRYGWGHVYWLRIEGLPEVWCERALGLTVPSWASSESPALAVDGSARVGAVIERDASIGAGFPLSFALLDSGAYDTHASIAAYMQRPTASSTLTEALNASSVTLKVHDSADFAASGTVWVGRERMTYTGKTSAPDTLTGVTRGSPAYPWPLGARVSDLPLAWAGRAVTLYAAVVDPAGNAPGATWEACSVAIWRGHLDSEPERGADGWHFSALPIDRLLTRQQSGAVSGVAQTNTGFCRVLSPHSRCTVSIRGVLTDGTEHIAVMDVQPFAARSAGDWLSTTEATADVLAALNDALSAYTAAYTWLDEWIVEQTDGKVIDTIWQHNRLALRVSDVAAGAKLAEVGVYIHSWFDKTANVMTSQGWGTQAGLSQTVVLPLDLGWWQDPKVAPAAEKALLLPGSTMIRFDAADIGSVPTGPSLLRVGDALWSSSAASQIASGDAGLFHFAETTPVGAVSAATIPPGSHVEVATLLDPAAMSALSLDATPAAITAAALTSSGQSGLRDATYDRLPGRLGLSLPSEAVDVAQIVAQLSELDALLLAIDLGGASVEDALGGLLRLGGQALVLGLGIDSDARLRAVRTSAYASGAAVAIGDEHVICYPDRDARQYPVPRPAAAVVDLGEAGKLRMVDVSRAATDRAEELAYEVRLAAGGPPPSALAGLLLARLVGDSQASVIELDVVPWLGVAVGDAVELGLTLPELWDFAAGAPGFAGRARCIGREVSLDSGVCRLRLAVDGLTASTRLSPATPIVSYADAGGLVATIVVSEDYYDLFESARQNGASSLLRLLVYRPGVATEYAAHYLVASAVAAPAAGTITLTVDEHSSGLLAYLGSGDAWVTWPVTTDASAWQQQWMHAGDGTVWG